MRRTIAKRLAESIGPIPHFFLTIDLDVTNLLSVRQQLIDGRRRSAEAGAGYFASPMFLSRNFSIAP